MKKITLLKITKTALLFSLMLVWCSLSAWAQNNQKVSNDLKDRVAKGGTVKIPVIISTPAVPTSALKSAIPGNGGLLKRTLNKVNAITCELPPAAVALLAARTDVKYVALDREAKVNGHLETTTGAALVRNYGTTGTGTIDGRGIGIAILDSGINTPHSSFLKDPANPASGSRVAYSIDFTGTGTTEDVYGHGSHVAGMAAAGSRVAAGAYTGIASTANLINVRVLDANGVGSAGNVIAGIDWCITNKATYNIKVMNLSLGTTAVDSYLYDPLCVAVRRAFDAGIVVVVAAGNAGKDSLGNKTYGSIHSPGTEPSAITVGAANTYGTDARNDDTVTTYSSRGPTRGYWTDLTGVRHYDNLIKPDLIAPGNWLIEPQSPNNNLVLANPQLDANVSNSATKEQMYLSGTSMAAPAVAGAVALLLQRNPSLTPNLVKAILEYTAQPVANFNNLEQGAGLMNVEGAVRLAGLVRADLTGRVNGDPLFLR